MVTLIYGKSGSGKSRSMKNLNPDEVLLINVQKKPLPFRGKLSHVFVPVAKENMSVVDNIIWCINKALPKYPSIKVIVIDDAGYLMTQIFMAKHKQKQGSASFDLYNEIGDDFWKLFNYLNTLPEAVNTYVLMHEDVSDYGDVKLRTIGKLLDQKVSLEGMVTVCLRCMTDGKTHWFQTQNTGNDISKSPEEMFPADKIDNDLQYVDTTIREYYGMNNSTKESA